jgi:phosphate-selective porin OprO/OprP
MRRLLVVILLMVGTSSGAGAQTASPLTVAWQDGLVMQSAGGEVRLQLGALVQADGRFSVDDPPPIVDTFLVRKARPIVSGRIAKYFDFRLMPDFGNGSPTLADAWFDTRFSNALRVRIGKDKVPIGYEILIGDANVFFPERSLVSSLVPLRDVGVQAQGDLAGARVSYAAGVFNGIPDGTTSSADVDANGGKDLAGRILVRTPSGFGAHLGGSTGVQSGPLPSFKTSIGQNWFSYVPDAIADGRRNRLLPAAFYYHGPVGVFGEYARSTQTVERFDVGREVTNTAWDVTATYTLTGEASTDRGVRPGRPFDPAAHHWGAVQFIARRSHLDVDGDVFDGGLASPRASRRAHQTSVGVDWYPTSFVKWYATYEHIEFHGGAARPHENAVIVRGQLAF